MAFQIVYWNSCQKICCGEPFPKDIIVCLPPERVAQHACVGGGLTNFPWTTIDAQLMDVYVVNNDCLAGLVYRYTVRYDDAQILGDVLQSGEIAGILCAGCMTSFVTESAGNEIFLTGNEDGSVTLTTQHGCTYTFNPAGIGVQDTASVDLTLLGGILTADVNISADAGNILEEHADGLFVPSDAMDFITAVNDTTTVDLDVTANTLSADVNVSADGGNQIQIRFNGLFVEVGAGVNVTDSSSINFDVPVPGTVTGDVIVSPDAGNILVSQPNGLFVPTPAADFIQSVSDTQSIDLDVTAANLTANAIISPDANNQLVSQLNGLFVPLGAGIAVLDTTTVDLTLAAGVISADVIQSAIHTDGWIPTTDSWTFASATTMNIPAGGAARYAVGDKLKFTQTTVKYFNVVSVADTLLGINGGTDYTFVNAAVSNQFYSHAESPNGFPGAFNYTASPAGSVITYTPAATTARYWMVRTECHWQILTTGTTSGAISTDLIFNLPFTAVTTSLCAGGCALLQGGTRTAGFYWNVGSTTVVIVSPSSGGMWGNGANTGYSANGFYQIA